jgi:hypothetical protein
LTLPILYHNCTVSEFLQELTNDFSSHPPFAEGYKQPHKESTESKIKIVTEGSLSSLVLCRYLHQRRIPMEVAKRFCKEVKYQLNGREYFGIGFKNDCGGYEIRNPF